MKQHITAEQLKELTVAQRRELMKWAEEKSYLVYKQVGTFEKLPKPVLKGFLPQFSIGQLIEFLLDKENQMVVEGAKIPGDLGEVVWVNNTQKRWEFCDALWEAVKANLS